MKKLYLVFSVAIILLSAELLRAKTYVFFEDNFPSAENGTVSRGALQKALESFNPVFITGDYLRDSTFNQGDMLILPYGSAFPVEAWKNISSCLNKCNLLIIGGTPFNIPVTRNDSVWTTGFAQNTFSRALGIQHKYPAPQQEMSRLQWDEDAPFFTVKNIKAKQVFVNAGYGDRYRGLAYFLDKDGTRISAPVAAEDAGGFGGAPVRRVFLNFEAETGYWESADGISLIQQAAQYASFGGTRLWVDLQNLTVEPGGFVTGSVDAASALDSSTIVIELLDDSKVIASRKADFNNKFHEEIGLNTPLNRSGLYKVRISVRKDGNVLEQYTSGVFVRDLKLLHSGKRLTAGRDYFMVDGKPFLPVGVNYFSTDKNTSGFFVGGSLGGNAWNYEKDFAEMERLGLNTVRTGIWLNRFRYLDVVTGAADERLLRSIEAYLHAAARHNIQVIFTFFAFEPQSEMEPRRGQQGNLLGPGANPYVDEAAFNAQAAYVTAIASRFKDVPFISFDLINEPSFNNPGRLWKGNSPNGDPNELAAWQNWLAEKYISIDSLAAAWLVPASQLQSFNNIPVPEFPDLELQRFGNQRTVRAIDFNLFAQDAFMKWADKMIAAIRGAGAQQVVTVGQDEGGVAIRLLNHFWANTNVNYTTNHTWWRDDAMLWNSVAAKTPYKPNLIGETGLQPVWSMTGSWRHDELTGFPLLERKLVLGFANANAGVLYWDWTQTDPFGILRIDGSYRQWMDILKGIADFAKDAHQYVAESVLPQTAIIFSQSLQLSTFANWGIEAQQKSIRALYHFSHAAAFTAGEYQLSQMPDAKLLIVPAPWVLSKTAWEQLLNKVKAGAAMFISGRIDADEHWLPDTSRTQELKLDYSFEALLARECEVQWPGGSAFLTYSSDKTTYGERGVLPGNKTFTEISLGKGKILYSPLPLEIADQLDVVGKIYDYALKQAGVESFYETTVTDPGILIAPTRLPEATLYVLTSESSNPVDVNFTDKLSGKSFTVKLLPGRGALLLIDKSGKIAASYNAGDLK